MRRIFAFCILLQLVGACNQKPATDEKNSNEPLTLLPSGAVNSFPVNDDAFYCNYDGQSTQKQFYTFASQTEMAGMAALILKQVGLPSNFEVIASNVPNATAFMYTTGTNRTRYIFYSARFFLDVEDSTKTDWGKVSILAHEIGHHLAGHTLTKEKRAGNELEADKFSGFILRRMGATKEESIAAIEKMGSEAGTETHPDKRTRADAILAGWEEADFQQPVLRVRSGGTQPPDMPQPLPKVNPEQTVPRGPRRAPSQFDSILPVETFIEPTVTRAINFAPFYIVYTGSVKTKAKAKAEKNKLAAAGYKADYLWMPDYNLMDGQQRYLVYLGPFSSQFNCELAVESYRSQNPGAFGILVSPQKNNLRIDGMGKVTK